MLAERIEVKPITLARLIDRVEAAGWVERVPDPADRRVSRLYLTPKAQPILDEMGRRAAQTLEEALAGMPQQARDGLVEALRLMKENLSAPDQDGEHGRARTAER